MNNSKLPIILAWFCLAGCAQAPAEPVDVTYGVQDVTRGLQWDEYPADMARPEETASAALQKFRDEKFGMMVHWGLYSLLGGEWQNQTSPYYAEWIQNFQQIPNETYHRLAEEFRAESFDAAEWVRLAKSAGMRYMVVTAKHHEGFALYDSASSEFDVVDSTPRGRDIIGELHDASRRANLGFGVYYSQDLDWSERHGYGNTWDFPEDRDPAVYFRSKALPQVRELVRGYEDLLTIWFDTPTALNDRQVLTIKETVRRYQPDVLINGRLGRGLGNYVDFDDNARPVQPLPNFVWQTSITTNDSYGWKIADRNFKSPRMLTTLLIDVVSKGGNLILNVGPTGAGSIPRIAESNLLQVGSWLVMNGEAIYGTRACPLRYTSLVWRCTRKEGVLYFHVLDWSSGRIDVPGIKSAVTSASLVASGKQLIFEQKQGNLSVEVPADAAQKLPPVVKVTLVEPIEISRAHRYDARPVEQEFLAIDARPKGEQMEYDWDNHTYTNFTNPYGRQSNRLIWYPRGELHGVYRVAITYSLAENSDGEHFEIGSTYRSEKHSEKTEVFGTLRGILPSTNGRLETVVLEKNLPIPALTRWLTLKFPKATEPDALAISKLTLTRLETLPAAAP